MGKSADHDIPVDHLRECFAYDPETGVLTWRDRPRSHFKSEGTWKHFRKWWTGRRVGTRVSGYLLVFFTLDGVTRTTSAHRIAYALQTGAWPLHEIDHIDGVRDNNRWANLRPATHAENGRNSAWRREAAGMTIVRYPGQTSLRLAPDVVEWLSVRSREEERSPAYLVMRLIRAEMQREKPQKTKAREARK